MTKSLPLCLLLAVATSTTASAQGLTAEADAKFDQGKQLMAKNDFVAACAAFEDSQKLAPATTTLMNLANCREKNQQLATAHALFTQVQQELAGKADKASSKLREVATQRATALAAKLSRLTLIVPSASKVPGLEITRDDIAVAAAQWNQPVVLDGGAHVIVARAPGHAEWTTTVDVAASGDTKTLEVPALAPTAAGDAPATTTTTTGTAALTTPPVAAVEPRRAGSTTLPIVLGVSAVVLGGAALGFELWGRSIYSDAEAATSDRAEQVRLWDSANARHYVAQGAGIAALGCAAGAVITFLTRDKGEPEQRMTFAPLASPTSVGIGAFARW